MRVAIIGYGGRGMLYAEILKEKGVEISAVCDVNKAKLALAQKRLELADGALYAEEETFFRKGKLADLLIVSTQDQLHLRHAVKGLDLGYDLLLEKPIAASQEECETILNKAQKLDRRVFVCHVLRYAPFFSEIKRRLSSGKYGKVVTIAMTENVAYWHQAHSYVRGNWRNDKISTPMILAKCCHDLDLIVWFMNDRCGAVSSFGKLSYFVPDNAPKDAAERCLDCRYVDSCPYSAKKIYIQDRAEKGILGWPCDIVVSEPTVEKLYEALKHSPYGKCVFRCDNNAVDHQVVNMSFIGGATAQLTMTAFSKDCYREIHVHCENGEIYGNMKENRLYCNLFGSESEEVNVDIIADSSYGHGGGDWRLLEDVLGFYEGKAARALTSIENSIQSHFIGFAAESSRLAGGKLFRL
jgi:oxidoreductase domain protein